MRPVVVSKRTSRTYRPELTLAPGPAVLAQPGEGTYPELYGCPWVLALHRDGPQLYQLVSGEWVPRADPGGALLELASGARHVALAWDQAARPVVAWERAALVYVRQWQAGAGYVTRGPWSGRDPLLTVDALAGVALTDSDVLLLYLSDQSVMSRAQRDAYGVAVAVAAVSAGAVLDQVVAASGALHVFGEADGLPLVLSSDSAVAVSDTARARAPLPAGGVLAGLIVTHAPPSDTARAAAPLPDGGVLVDVTTPGTVAADGLRARSPLPAGGVLTQPLVIQAVPGDAARVRAPLPTGGTLL